MQTISDLLRREQIQADTPESVNVDTSGNIDRYDPRTTEMGEPEYKSDRDAIVADTVFPPYPPPIFVTPESKQFEVFRQTLTPGSEVTFRVAFQPDYWRVYAIRGSETDGFYAFPAQMIMVSIAPWTQASQMLTLPGRDDALTVAAESGNAGSLNIIAVALRNAIFDKG